MRTVVPLSIVVTLVLVGSGISRAQEFRVGDWRAYALVGPASLREKIQYVSFSGDHGLRDWLPNEHDLVTDVERETALLSRFQLRVINLELPLPGLSASPLAKRIDDVVLYSLTAAGYNVAARANNHGMDLGAEGLRYTEQRLASAGLQIIGERKFPVFRWQAGHSRIDICAMADAMDHPDPDHLILMIDDEGLAVVNEETRGADFRIAFLHLGSASRFLSPHERGQAERLLNAGFGLVVCTGSHFIKGLLFEQKRPVAYGIGDHLLSVVYGRRDTEPLGMHLVAGFDGGRLVQVFVVPFHNDIRRGRLGPLDEVAFGEFVRTLQSRSTSDEAKYYSDAGALKAMLHGIATLPRQLTSLRPRHFTYAARLVLRQRPEWIAAIGSLLAGAVAAALLRQRSRRLRQGKGKA